jgi:hypothetical protein
MTGDAAIIGLVAGLVIAAVVVFTVHLGRRRRPERHGTPGRHPTGQGAAGIDSDPGQSRPAGPGAESQAPQPSAEARQDPRSEA